MTNSGCDISIKKGSGSTVLIGTSLVVTPVISLRIILLIKHFICDYTDFIN